MTYWIILNLDVPCRPSGFPVSNSKPHYMHCKIHTYLRDPSPTIRNLCYHYNGTPIHGRWETEASAIRECKALEEIHQVMDR